MEVHIVNVCTNSSTCVSVNSASARTRCLSGGSGAPMRPRPFPRAQKADPEEGPPVFLGTHGGRQTFSTDSPLLAPRALFSTSCYSRVMQWTRTHLHSTTYSVQ